MRTEIIKPNGNLKREVWTFRLDVDTSRSAIYLDYYSFQTKETTRHKWRQQTHWEKFDRRNNNIDTPTIPDDVETEVRSRYQEYIMTLPVIVYR